MPLAATVKLASAPVVTLWSTGWAVIVGGILTVKVAAPLVALPAAFVTTHV